MFFVFTSLTLHTNYARRQPDMMGADENLGVLFVPLAGFPLNKKRDIWVPLAPKIEGQPVSGDIRLRLLLTDA